jgi:exonuclease VII small subunit
MKKNTLGESLKKIEALVAWFEEQKEVDVEQGIEKVRQGVALIKESKLRLQELENEFEEVKKEL